MAHPYKKSSPVNQIEYGESRGEGHKSGESFRSDPADRKAFEALSQVQKDSLHNQANLYGKPFFSPKYGVNVDPEDGVLSFRPIYSDNTKLTYDKINKPFNSGINRSSNSNAKNKSKFLKTAWDVGSTFLKGAPGVVATFLTPQTAYAHQDGKWVTNPDGSKQWKKFEFFDDSNEGGLLPKFKEEETPLNIKEEAYEKQNRKMRKKHKKETGNTLGERQTKGTGKRRVSFACRFAGMKGEMKDAKGEPTKYAMALKKWGFGSREAARNFCNKNKES